MPSHRSDVPALQSDTVSDWHQWYLTETKAPAHVTQGFGSWALHRDSSALDVAVIEQWRVSQYSTAGWINPDFDSKCFFLSLWSLIQCWSSSLKPSRPQRRCVSIHSSPALQMGLDVTIWVHYITSFKTLCWFLRFWFLRHHHLFTDTCFIIYI